MTKRNPEFGGFSACFAVRAETDRKGKATPPARTETMVTGQPSKIKRNFNPLRPRGRRRTPSSLAVALKQFQPTPPARTETRFGIRIQEQPFISTHSAREDGDFTFISVKGHSGVFQPTPPARTETAILHKKTNNSSSHFHNQITSYPLKSPPTYPAHIQNRSHCAVFPVRIPP